MRELAELTQEQATDRLAECMITSESTISRLEGLHVVPPSRKRRMTAWALSVLYGFHPGELDLTVDDAPPPAVLDRLAVRLDEGIINRPSVAEDRQNVDWRGGFFPAWKVPLVMVCSEGIRRDLRTSADGVCAGMCA